MDSLSRNIILEATKKHLTEMQKEGYVFIAKNNGKIYVGPRSRITPGVRLWVNDARWAIQRILVARQSGAKHALPVHLN